MIRPKATLLLALLVTSAAQAHPGHTHSHNALERLLHALQTEWLPLLLPLAVAAVAGYLYRKWLRRDS